MTDRVRMFTTHKNKNLCDTHKNDTNVNIPSINRKTDFVAGNIKNHIDEWYKLTDDKHVLETVTGCKIELSEIPYQSNLPKPLNVSEKEAEIIDNEIESMLKKQVIKISQHENDEFISGIFLRPKKEEGKFRVILNLKPFNHFVVAEHFKMDTIVTCIELMSDKCFMASIDLRDAYYSIPMDESDQKYLKFIWRGQLYQYTCLPMGLACAPRKFVKLLKPVFAFLHARGHISSGYLDDTYIQGDSYQSCMANVTETIELLTKLGFYVHIEKSVTTPCRIMEHLGFILNSENMTVSVTEGKYNKLIDKIDTILNTDTPTIRLVASAIGSMVSYTIGVQFGSLFYKQLEIDKSLALKEKKGNFDEIMTLSELSIEHLRWWKDNAMSLPFNINHADPNVTICTDASISGWGAKMGVDECGGRWTLLEKEDHINILELKAILFGLKSLCKDLRNKHILVKSDNTTAVAYVRNMGGCKSIACNNVAREIWLWAISTNNWLSITHIEGRLNIEPDKLSRVFDDHTEWMINPVIFKQIAKHYNPSRDLFASRINKQLSVYSAWQPDPQAFAVDAFSFNWANHMNYIFPPFALLNRVMAKLEKDSAEGIVIVPLWTTQSWFAKMLNLLTDFPKLLPRSKKQLMLPFDQNKIHPLWRKMHLLVCPLSGDSCKTKVFRRRLKTLSYSPGGQLPGNNTIPTYKNGIHIAIEGMWIPLDPL